jgi:hypothetical protein
VHTFNVLFLGITVPRYVMYITVMAGWASICTIIFIIPAAIDTVDKGPFFAISGMWCWISPQYSLERIVLDYMEVRPWLCSTMSHLTHEQMFISSFLCFVLYTLVFLRMRGIITRENGQWFMSFKTARRNSIGKDEKFGRSIARRMIWYPVAYTALLLPISFARFLDWSGVDVPSEATLFCDAVFLLSGAHVCSARGTHRADYQRYRCRERGHVLRDAQPPSAQGAPGHLEASPRVLNNGHAA